MSTRPDLSGLRVLAGLLALTVLPACGPIEVPVNLNLDPSGPNELSIELPTGMRTSQLTGGVGATIVLDTDKLLTWNGVFATLQVDEVRIAGSSFQVIGDLSTGTICLTQDPDAASGGFAYLRPLVKKEADVQLTLATLAFVTDPVLAPFAPPLPFGATLDTQVPLSLSDLLALAAGEGGSLTITETIVDTIPEDVDLFGGAEVMATVTLSNSDVRAEGPLLDECDAFLAAL